MITLRTVVQNAVSIKDLEDILKRQYKLVVTRFTLNCKTALHVVRSEDDSELSDTVQEECTICVIDGNKTIVSRSVPKIWDADDPFCGIDMRKINDGLYTAYEWLDGTLVAVSRVGNEYIISTKAHPFGRDHLPNSKLTAEDVVQDILDRANPHLGIEMLFEALPGLEDICWSFMIVPKYRGRVPVTFSDFELYLVYGYRTISCKSLDKGQLINAAFQFGVKCPELMKIRDHKDIPDCIREWGQKQSSLRGLILRDDFGNFGKIRSLKSAVYRDAALCRRLATKLKPVVDARESLAASFTREPELTKFLSDNMQDAVEHVNFMWDAYGTCPTHKSFALSVGNDPFKNVLFALRRGKIDSVGRISEVLNPITFANILVKKYGQDQIRKLLNISEG